MMSYLHWNIYLPIVTLPRQWFVIINHVNMHRPTYQVGAFSEWNVPI